MPRSTLTFDSPLDPSEFQGRADAVAFISARLNDREFLSASVVGGPRTGKTSLLRYLASPKADEGVKGRCRVYLDMQLLESTATPKNFWMSTLRAMDAVLAADAPRGVVKDKLKAARDRALDDYDAEDVFDACAKASSPVALLLDNFENLLDNRSFWGDFFHTIRALGQRTPRGLAFVTATQRGLLDLWNPQMGSPYYNIFLTKRIGRLSPEEISEHLRVHLSSVRGPADLNKLAGMVQSASDGHPFLVSCVTGILRDQLEKGNIDADALRKQLVDPDGPAVQLAREIRGALTLGEQEALAVLRSSPEQLTASQRSALERLNEDCLLPPGTRLAWRR
jgi:hypothetical protein